MTKTEPITSKFNKELWIKFINSPSMLHRRLVLWMCNCHRCYSDSDVFIACMKNLGAESIQELLTTIQSTISLNKCVKNASKHNHIYGNYYMLRSTQTTIKSLLQKLSTKGKNTVQLQFTLLDSTCVTAVIMV